MSKRKCAACGKDPAAGYASTSRFIDGKWVETWLCHGDDDETTCYMSDQMGEGVTRFLSDEEFLSFIARS